MFEASAVYRRLPDSEMGINIVDIYSQDVPGLGQAHAPAIDLAQHQTSSTNKSCCKFKYSHTKNWL